MRVQRLTSYLMQHRVAAASLMFLLAFVPVLGVVAIIYAGLVTLRKGWVEGGVFTLAATLPYAIGFFFSGTQQDPAALLALCVAVGVAVLSNVLTWVFALMLRRHASWSQILQVAALMGVLFISVVHLLYPDVADWWGNELTELLKGRVLPFADAKQDDAITAINVTKLYATGIMTISILFNALLQLVAARWWQALVYSPGLLRRELHDIRLSPLAGFLFILSLVFSYLGNSVVLDIMPVLYVLFGVAGLSLLHYLFGLMKSPVRWFWIWFVYVTLIFALPTSMILVGLLGLLDIWLDIRKRLKMA